MWKKSNLEKFMYEAKKNTFASGSAYLKSNRGLKVYSYQSEDFHYQDQYYGNIIDSGSEHIFYNDKPIWSMVFRGGMCDQDYDSKSCFIFLKEALFNLPKDFPVRGPDLYVLNDLEYINNYTGTLYDFWGVERILFKDELIYLKKYQGGITVDNSVIRFDPIYNSIIPNI